MSPRLGIVVLVVALTACDKSLTPAEDRTVRRWLLCDECVDGELDSLLALGPAGFEAMKRAVEGPPRDRITTMRRQANTMYDRMASPPLSRERYVDRYVGNYIAGYKARAIVALRRMGTPQAHAVLVDALRPDNRHRSDVRRLLGEAVGTQLSIVEGDSQHAPLGTTVRIDPTVEVRDSTTNQVMSRVRVVFRVDSGGGSVADSVRLTTPNGRAWTTWRLGSTDSMNVLKVIAAGRVARVHALAHAPGPRIVFVAQPSDAVTNQPMVPPAQIAIQDAWGTTLTHYNGSAIVDLTAAPSGAAMSVANVVNGVAAFSGLRVPQAGTGFKLRVRMINLAPAQSDPFDVVPP